MQGKQETEQGKEIEKEIMRYFPKKPYKTQLYIAHSLFQILSEGKVKVAIVESPTGTGKTYALLAGVLAWLSRNSYSIPQNVKKKRKSLEESQNDSSIPSWLATKATENRLSKILHKKEQKMKKMKTIKEYKLNPRNLKYKQNKKQENLEWQVQDIEDIGDDLDGDRDMKGVKKLNKNLNLEDAFIEGQCLPKVIFVSRTHTQLGQVMDSIQSMGMEWKYISMASKDHLCVHPNIEKNRVHQKCQYFLSHGGCPYYHQQPLSDFLGLRIEQAQKLGRQNSLCSYFSLKNLLPLSDILCVPYPTILNPQIRTRLHIVLKNSLVIFDEAHNIIEQQLNIKSPEIGYKELMLFCARIDEYKGKYGSRMAEGNLGLLGHLQEVLRAVMGVVKGEWGRVRDGENGTESGYVKMSKIELFRRLKLPEIKVHKIKNYISLSNLDQKLVHLNPRQPFPISIINSFLDFLTILTTNTPSNTPSLDPTLILIKNLPIPSTSSSSQQPLHQTTIKIFTMQSTELAQIIKQARLVILAGGTMEPINCFTSIFKQNGLGYRFVKGQHVIKEEQCRVYCIAGASEGKEKFQITFTYNQMKFKSKAILQNACRIIKQIIKKAQKNSGTAIFLQNYSLIQVLSQHLGQKVHEIPIFYDGDNKKQKGNAFQLYQKQIKQKKNSAVLVSVMGGRLSEGINFSDELARNIIVLGLPYPNLKSAEIAEKMNYLDAKLRYKFQLEKQNNGLPTFESANKKYKKQSQNPSETPQTGQSYYQTCCTKTINQTIGRGIRHINDYANIYLIDSRFAGLRHRLPSWMTNRVKFIDYFQC